MDIPMAPALGLYLYELFFEGYNLKQQRQIIKDKVSLAKKRGGSKSNNSQPSQPDHQVEDKIQEEHEQLLQEEEDEGENKDIQVDTIIEQKSAPDTTRESNHEPMSVCIITTSIDVAATMIIGEDDNEEDDAQVKKDYF
jgi:hypothetical protein